jgi:hypothetical protein
MCGNIRKVDMSPRHITLWTIFFTTDVLIEECLGAEGRRSLLSQGRFQSSWAAQKLGLFATFHVLSPT